MEHGIAGFGLRDPVRIVRPLTIAAVATQIANLTASSPVMGGAVSLFYSSSATVQYTSLDGDHASHWPSNIPLTITLTLPEPRKLVSTYRFMYS